MELSPGESNKENKEKPSETNTPQKKPDNPPSPTSVPVPQPSLTAEDTLKLHSNTDRKDDDISLIVHVDDTQNDLDNDLLNTPIKKPTGEGASIAKKPEGEKETGSSTVVEKGTGSEVSKAEGDVKTSTSPKKSTADPKKSPADGKKAEGSKKEDATKKAGDKDTDKKDSDKSKRLVCITP